MESARCSFFRLLRQSKRERLQQPYTNRVNGLGLCVFYSRVTAVFDNGGGNTCIDRADSVSYRFYLRLGNCEAKASAASCQTSGEHATMNLQELNSWMLFVHPPLAIAGYILIFLFTIFLFSRRQVKKGRTNMIGVAAWVLTFLGLVSGMIWAELAWGTYWSWDPKETLTLILFLSVSASFGAYREHHSRLSKWVSVFSCSIVILNALSSVIIAGLHSFA